MFTFCDVLHEKKKKKNADKLSSESAQYELEIIFKEQHEIQRAKKINKGGVWDYPFSSLAVFCAELKLTQL